MVSQIVYLSLGHEPGLLNLVRSFTKDHGNSDDSKHDARNLDEKDEH